MMNTDMNKHELREPGALQEQEGGGSDPSSTGVSEALEEHRLTPEETEQLKEQAAKATENREQMLRVAADFENFKSEPLGSVRRQLNTPMNPCSKSLSRSWTISTWPWLPPV